MWHTRGIVQHGGIIEDVRFAERIGLAIMELYEVKTGHIIPVDQIGGLPKSKAPHI